MAKTVNWKLRVASLRCLPLCTPRGGEYAPRIAEDLPQFHHASGASCSLATSRHVASSWLVVFSGAELRRSNWMKLSRWQFSWSSHSHLLPTHQSWSGGTSSKTGSSRVASYVPPTRLPNHSEGSSWHARTPPK